MRSLTTIIALLGLQSTVSAHMLMSNPPSLRYKGNKNVPSDKIDNDMTSPLHGDGSNFPCKGYQVDLGTPLGASVADWPAGSSQSFSIEGGAFHNGGSCQAALSYDTAKTFTVIHSYIGNCPTSSGGSFPFTIPADAPAGAALFAWTWFNNVGNREMYMNCASVTIKGSGSKKRADTSFSSRPSIFTANIGSDCHTLESLDVDFPNPGPDLTNVTHAHGSPTGKQCQAVSGSSPPAVIPAANPTSQGASSAMLPSFTSAAQSASSATISSYTSAGHSANSATAPSSTPTAQGGSSPSADGSCGAQASCIGSVHGSCCSQWGYCGSTPAYCGTGCQSAFGTCGTSNTTGSPSALQVSVDKTCGPSTSNTCQGSSYGNCCSQYGYCGSTGDYCGTGCQSGFGTCGTSPVASSPVASPPAASPPATGSSSTTSSPSTPSSSPANPVQSSPSTFITMASAKSSASAVTVIPVTGY